MLVNINKLREEQTGLIDRFNAVIAALKAKGGEVAEYEKYVAAVSGVNVDLQDIKDVSAFRIIVWGWLKSTQGGLRWLKNISFFLLTLLVSYIFAVVLGRITQRTVSVSKKFSDLLRQFFVSAVRKTVMIIGIIIALSMLEIDIAPLVAGLGVAGFILGFALQGTLSNFASGLMILIYRPFDVGHIIEAAGIRGKVDSMSLVSTTVTTPDNQIVVVPNGEIWGGVITNVTGSKTRRIDMTFGISYSDDISKASQILERIVSTHELILKDPEPTIKVHELGDSSVNFVCRPWVKTADYWTVYWDVTRAVKEQFDAEGVSIPFPQRDVHLFQASNKE
jgi:small conductance mechanosensitive channel